MRPTIWLASYPKSGNTWFRILLANLDPARETPAEINSIDSTDSIASARGRFDNNLLVDAELLRADEVDALRPALYRHLAQDQERDPFDPESSYPVRFVKTHDAYTHLASGEAMMGGVSAAAGALLFVRDPRDVAPSLANHQSCTIDVAIAQMADTSFCFCEPGRNLPRQLRQQLSGWSGFAQSWLDQSDIPVHLVLYEDLHKDPVATIRGALDFAGWPQDDAAIERAVRFASMDEVQRQEGEGGFAEKPRKTERFFRRGVAGGWRDELDPAQVARIEQDHAAMMARLGYAPSAT